MDIFIVVFPIQISAHILRVRKTRAFYGDRKDLVFYFFALIHWQSGLSGLESVMKPEDPFRRCREVFYHAGEAILQ